MKVLSSLPVRVILLLPLAASITAFRKKPGKIKHRYHKEAAFNLDSMSVRFEGHFLKFLDFKKYNDDYPFGLHFPVDTVLNMPYYKFGFGRNDLMQALSSGYHLIILAATLDTFDGTQAKSLKGTEYIEYALDVDSSNINAHALQFYQLGRIDIDYFPKQTELPRDRVFIR